MKRWFGQNLNQDLGQKPVPVLEIMALDAKWVKWWDPHTYFLIIDLRQWSKVVGVIVFLLLYNGDSGRM